MSTSVLQIAARLEREGRAFMLATVVSTAGRTPRDPGDGARMIWLPESPSGEARERAATGPAGLEPSGFEPPGIAVCDRSSQGESTGGGTIIGTVGGGKMEQMIIEACRARFAARSSGLEHITLKEDADQCCGGTMDVFVEFIGRMSRVVIFGAGHVAAALAAMLSDSPIEVVIVDDRAEWNSEQRFPCATRRVRSWEEGVRISIESPSSTSVCVMTYDHDRDFELVRQLIEVRGAGGERAMPAYLGLIGSRSKRACFFGRLAARGIGEDLIARIECPMGLGDMGKSPREVAVSIAGRLLLQARAYANRG